MLSESLLYEFDNEMSKTRTVLARIPDGTFEWKPHEKSFSMRDLAVHVANIPAWVSLTLETDELDLAEPFEPPSAASGEELLAMFDANVGAGREKIASATDDALGRPWTLKQGDVEHFSVPKHAVIRNFVLNHTIHHRAQLTVYLRLNDVPVPAVYGPSADEEAF